MKPETNKKKPKPNTSKFADVFVEAAGMFGDEQLCDAAAETIDRYIEAVCANGIPNALQSFERLVELVTDLDEFPHHRETVMHSLFDYSVWTIYECSLSDQELAFVQLKHGDLIEQIRRDEEE